MILDVHSSFNSDFCLCYDLLHGFTVLCHYKCLMNFHWNLNDKSKVEENEL